MDGKNHEHKIRTYLRVIPNGCPVDEILGGLEELTGDICLDKGSVILCRDDEYNVDVNVMIRRTIAPFLGKEDVLKRLQSENGADVLLEIVPEIWADNDHIKPILSLDADIIEFLYKSGACMDLDYYIY